jgi:hypothetical protein
MANETTPQPQRSPFEPLIAGYPRDPQEEPAPTKPPAEDTSTPPTPPNVPASDSSSTDVKNVTQTPSAQPRLALPPEHTDNPSVKRAGVIRSIAEVLAGGPRYGVTTDVNTGEIKRQERPLSGRELGMAIALEAITGGLAGLSAGKGRGAGAAGMAGMNQGMQQVQQRRQNEDAEFARHAAIARTNMQMAANQRSLAEADRQVHQHDVDTYAPLYQMAQQANAVDTVVSEDELHKMLQDGSSHITKDMVIPVRVVEKMGPDGKPVTGAFGKPEYEKMYAVVKPNVQLTMPEEVRKILVDNKVQGYVDSKGNAINLPDNLELRLHKIVDGIEKANTIRWAQEAFDGYGRGQANPLHQETAPGAKTAALPEIKDEKIASLVDQKANQYGIDPALLRSLIVSESQGNPRAKSPKGAQGLGQLMPATAKAYGVKDPMDPEQNLDGAARFLKDLLSEHNGDPRAALIAYHGKGFDGNTTGEQYADQILGRVTPQGNSEDQPFKPKMSVSDALQQRLLTDKDLQVMQQVGGVGAFLNGDPKKGELSAAQKLASEHPDKFSPQSIGRIINFMGGQEAIDKARNQRLLYFQKQQEDIAIDKAEREGRNKLKMDQEAAEHLQSYLNEPEGFTLTPEMASMPRQDLQQKLQESGVNVPKNFSSLYMAAHYRTPISSFAPRVWTKGSPYEMDMQTAESFIQQFINPDFDATKYAPKQKFRNELISANSKDGSAIRNAGTAVQHLQMLKQASDALRNSQVPLFNHIANQLGVAVKGDPDPTVFKAIAEKVNSEVEKVAMGGNQPYADQLKNGLENLSRDFGPETVDSIIKAYTGLMHGRIKTIDDASQAELEEHLHNVSPAVTKLFQQYGLETPWADKKQATASAMPTKGDVQHYKGDTYMFDGTKYVKQAAAGPAGQ